MFQCYLDDSGTSGLPVVTMAGFVAHLDQWEHLEPVFDGILNRYEVPVLHAKEFEDTDGCFKNWRGIKKRSFVHELFGAAKGRMYGVSMTVRKTRFVEEKKRKNIMHRQSPYGGCFTSIMFHIVTNPQLGPGVRSQGLAFLVETGNKNNAEINLAFSAWAKRDKMKSILRSIKFVPKRSCRAIQVADFFAYYTRRYMREKDRFSGNFILPYGEHLQAIVQYVPVWIRGGFNFSFKELGHIDQVPDFGTNFWGPPDGTPVPSG